MPTYHISITESGENGAPIVDAHGDLDAMAYHQRKADLDAGKEYVAELKELEAIHGPELRTVASVTGDPEIVSYVLLKRMRGERKAQEAPATAE